MTDFDEQWKNVMDEKFLTHNQGQFELNSKRLKEFLNLTGIKPWYKKQSSIKNKICLDAGCGPGRWTYAMMSLGANRVDSFDISSEAIKRCKQINPNSFVKNIM